MDLNSLSSLSSETSLILNSALSKNSRSSLANEAKNIEISAARGEANSIQKTRKIFSDAQKRLKHNWNFNLIVAAILFALFTVMAVVSIVSALILGKSIYSLVSGGISGVSLLTAIIWKPSEKMFESTRATQRLEIILLGYEEQIKACSLLAEDKRPEAIAKATKAALKAME